MGSLAGTLTAEPTTSAEDVLAEMLAGVRPIMSCASAPTACTSPVRSSIATTEGSDSTIPRPRT